MSKMAEVSLEELFELHGYTRVKRLVTGDYAGVMKMMFTAGLFVGLDSTGYKTRFCYEHVRDAERALDEWDGTGDPPGPWIKQKPEDRYGPGLG